MLNQGLVPFPALPYFFQLILFQGVGASCQFRHGAAADIDLPYSRADSLAAGVILFGAAIDPDHRFFPLCSLQIHCRVKLPDFHQQELPAD